MKWSFLFIFWITFPLFADQYFFDKNNQIIHLAAVKDVSEIVQKKGKEILVNSFMKGYEDVPLTELNHSFKSIGDVRRFYEDYFESELAHFKHGELIWVQAFAGEELVGWATFQLEANEKDAAYMNLLVVDPVHQHKGIGEHLVFSIEDLFPNIQAINVLIRKVNQQGRLFYKKIGFFDYEAYQAQDNFVDNSLLTPVRWQKG